MEKINIGFLFATIIFILVAFSGCIEINHSDNQARVAAPTSQPTYGVPSSTQQVMPSVGDVFINGNYKIQDVSGERIHINGNYNEITILNSDVTMIRVNGNYNTVYYPRNSRPIINENGSENRIKSY